MVTHFMNIPAPFVARTGDNGVSDDKPISAWVNPKLEMIVFIAYIDKNGNDCSIRLEVLEDGTVTNYWACLWINDHKLEDIGPGYIKYRNWDTGKEDEHNAYMENLEKHMRNVAYVKELKYRYPKTERVSQRWDYVPYHPKFNMNIYTKKKYKPMK